jgi:hypothetical protein
MNTNKLKRKKFKNKNKRNNRRNNVRRHQEYTYKIRTPIISYVSPDYTQRNLKFDIFDLLQSNPVFDKVLHMYNQYKLTKVIFAATPRIQQAHDPAPIWIYLDTEGYDTEFNYTGLPELQGSRSLPVKHFSLTSYSTSGRQKDFNYWEDFTEMKDGLAIRLHCAEAPTADATWQFQIQFNITVRGMKLPSTNNKKLIGEENKDEKVKITNRLESPLGNEQGLQKEDKKEEENEDEIWEHQDSDWDDVE